MTSAPIDVDALEAVAKAATPGPRRMTRSNPGSVLGEPYDPAMVFVGSEDTRKPWRRRACVTVTTTRDDDDARYIAAASPDVVLALIARVREAEIALADVHALLTNAGVEDPEVSHREGYALSLRALAMVELCRQQRDAAIEQRDAARAEVAVMSETLAHAAHARGAVEEYPDGTDELSLALERAEKAEAACAAMREACISQIVAACRLCGRRAPLDDANQMTGPIPHRGGCPVARDPAAPLLAELLALRAVRVAAERLHPTDLAPRYRCECEGDRRCDECALRGALRAAKAGG